MRGILSQVSEISNSQTGINLFRGNYTLTVQRQRSPMEKVMNKHGTFFQGLKSDRQIPISKDDESLKKVNTGFTPEYYKLTFEPVEL